MLLSIGLFSVTLSTLSAAETLVGIRPL